ncbi:thiolase family protein [Nitriliruptoraceae bacterium ZYF776]|nr:thiolase family protein [Profundirhabdus halotolerans]
MMTAIPSRSAAITGVGMSHFCTQRQDEDLPGLVIEAATLALDDAGLTMADIDAVVLSQAPDPLHGVGHPEQTVAGALALNGRPILRVHTGGATGASAAQVGWWAVASGRFDNVLVVGAEKMGDNIHGAQQVLNEIWDPAYEAPFPLNTISMTSLATVRYVQEYGATVEDYARVSQRLRDHGRRNEYAHLRIETTSAEIAAEPMLSWPITRGMACPRSSGGAAVVINSGDRARELDAPKAWIRAMTARANTYFMGDRMGEAGLNEQHRQHELRLAAREAYEIAGITDPRTQIDVAEPYVPFATMEPLMLEALELCDDGESLKLEAEGYWHMDGGTLPVCPSGGVMCSNPISVTALVRVAEAAQQVRGRAAGHQVPGATTAIATGAGGDAQFFAVAIVDGRDPESEGWN